MSLDAAVATGRIASQLTRIDQRQAETATGDAGGTDAMLFQLFQFARPGIVLKACLP